ncbi:UPF0149 family protein [Noviherbaspirillum pedocola]|uniref:UPF0149 family protein n=1 Tax=Noviherbaspirillum pedocola TaxID=2801341 RepID=A0A934SUZ7_9BURK|nr:UPF0149 family protein [Noviherbaspirillum pedocola]MBK4733292.1 UPF0149 family protein [Noviherbaspirillum pedocola]
MHLDEPLSDKEFNELDKFLMSERCSDECMTMDALHGYLTALAIGPQEVPFAEWLPRVWGPSPEDAPEFKSDAEHKRITGLIARVMNDIITTFEVAPNEYEPLFLELDYQGRKLLDAESWAWGFCEGMELKADAWQPLWDSDQAELLRPIYLLGAEEIEEEELPLVDNPVKCDKLAIEIEAAIPMIRRFWAPLRKSAVETVQRDAPKLGRNDPCPCGSGKKYKKCCGAEQGDA